MKNNDLISRSALLHDLSYSAPELWCDAEYVIAKIERQPSVEDVIHAHWIECDGYDGDVYFTCSGCDCEWTLIDGAPQENEMAYCPRCGAKMDEPLVRMSP